MKSKTLTPEERADEIVERFYKINNDLEKSDTSGTLPYISRMAAVLCAIELAKESIFISSKDCNAEWSNRASYWKRILEILENKLK